MGMKEEDRGQFAPAPFDPVLGRAPDPERDGYTIIIHADIGADMVAEMTRRVDAALAEIDGCRGEWGVIESFRFITTPLVEAREAEPCKLSGQPDPTFKGKRIAQWKLEQRGGRR